MKERSRQGRKGEEHIHEEATSGESGVSSAEGLALSHWLRAGVAGCTEGLPHRLPDGVVGMSLMEAR